MEAATARAGTPSFTDVTQQAGLDGFRHVNGQEGGKKWYPEQMGSGGGFFDYDGDGWQDIILLGGGTWTPARDVQALRLYRNNGDGTFADVTEAAGMADVDAYTIGVSAADYDNDGDDDVFVTTLEHDLLFRNDDGRFTEVGKEAGLSEYAEWGSSALFFDADRDGWLDLYVGNYADWSPETDKWCPEGNPVKLYCIPADYEGIPSRFYLNDGDGTFTERTAEAGFLPALGKSLGVVEIDYNRDGWPDLFVANDGEGDLLYENDGDGTFTERGVLAGVAFSEHGEARAGMGVDAGVVDSTGEVSLFVGNFSEEMAGLYRHQGNGLFLERSAASRVGGASLLTLTFGLFLFDVEFDGDLDLFFANGHVYPDRLEGQDKITFRQRPQLYLNDGDGTFEEVVASEGPLTDSLVARGAAYADYDRDGDLDVLLTENNGPAHLWRNDTDGGGFLRVVLRGRESNRSALGARVEVVAGGHRQERRVRTGSSYLSVLDRAAVFGLGAAVSVDTLRVVWPSGREEVVEGVAANREVVVEEGEGIIDVRPLPGRGEGALAHR